jgi:hypothetical protein
MRLLLDECLPRKLKNQEWIMLFRAAVREKRGL